MMTFLAMVAALLLYQAWGGGGQLHQDHWYRAIQARVDAWPCSPTLRLAAAVLGPVAIAGLIMEALGSVLFGLPWIAAAACLLLYSLGRGDYHAMLRRYRDHCRSGDFEGAWITAESRWGLALDGASPHSPSEAHAVLQRGLYYEGYQRWFGVLFWFLLLGPSGALAYRLLQLSRDKPAPAVARGALHLLDWLPVRVLAALFALTGDFVRCRDPLMAVLGDFRLEAPLVLQRVGDAALGDTDASAAGDFGEAAAAHNRDVEGLLARSAGAWLIVLSLLVLFA